MPVRLVLDLVSLPAALHPLRPEAARMKVREPPVLVTMTCLPLDIATDKSEIPVQPKICFPSRLFGASGRSFQAHWYKEFPWIEYSFEKYAIFCFLCRFFNLPCASQ